jgi:hypothetical protein
VTVQVIGTQFSKPGETGDFGWMLQESEYDDALFVFNDNEERSAPTVTSLPATTAAPEEAATPSSGRTSAKSRQGLRVSRPDHAARDIRR